MLATGCGLVDDSSTVAVAPIPITATSTSTTVATSTTTTTAVVDQPVDPPKQPYAPEAIRTIGTIDIPKIGLHAALGEGISLRNIDRGPSHWPGTAMPGQLGNVVVAGHRVTHSRPFLHLDELVPGDEVRFGIDGTTWRYVVTGHQVVTPKQTEIVNQTPDATGTLFACHPPGSARYRYVVHLRLAA